MFPSGDVADILPKFAAVFPFETFNEMQREALPALLESDKNAVISAPTGAGKTALAELAICRCLASAGTALFLAPLRALTAEKEAEWERFTDLGFHVYVVTGDRELVPSRAEAADILVMTPEKLDSATRKPHSARYGFISQVDCCVIDEVHLLGSEHRGSALEVTIARLRRQTDPRVIALSAALSNPEDIARWLDAPAENVLEFGNNYRPVPLDTSVATYTPGDNAFSNKYRRLDRALSVIEPHLGEDGQAICFVASREDARRGAEKAVTDLPIDSLALGLGDNYDARTTAATIDDMTLASVVKHGVAFHHAGLTRSDRELVEDWFKSGEISLLVSTSTLAWGVNLPARCVVVRDTSYHDPLAGDVPIRPIDIRQMVGRAGRPGYDSRGYAHVICSPREADRFESILAANIEVRSTLPDHLAAHLNAEVTLGTIECTESAIDWLETTYLAAYRSDISPAELLDSTLADLARRGFIDMAETGEITPTTCGELAARYYLQLETIEQFRSLLEKATVDRDAILESIALAAEFDNVHARQSERDAIDVLVPPTDSLSAGNRKVIATLQAAMTGEIPGALRSDGWAIKQNADRLLGALRAACRAFDRPRVELLACRLAHRIEYGVPEDAVAFTAIDGIGGRRALRLRQADIDHPAEIATMPADQLAAVGFGQQAIEQITADAASLPQLQIGWDALPSQIERNNNRFIIVPIENDGASERAHLTVRVNDVEMHRNETRLGTSEVPIGLHAGDADRLRLTIEIVFPDLPIDPVRDERVVAVTEGLKEIG